MAIQQNEIYVRRAATPEEQKQYGGGQNIDVGIGFAGDANIQRDIDAYKKAGYQIFNEPTAQTQTSQQSQQAMTAPGPLPGGNPSLLSQYTGQTMPDAEKIRQQEIERQNLAAQTQALNTLYDEQLSRERQKFAGYSGQQRALAARGGILSTPRDEAQQMELADKQRQVEGAINAERATKIAELTDRVNQRANERVQAERDFATSERDKYLATLKQSQAQARQDIAAFAQGGGSLTDLTTDQYQKLLKDTGMDDFALKATVNINNPKSKAQFTSVGDKLVGYYINPKTGQFETFESAPIPGISGGKYSLKETTKGLLAIPENLDPSKSLDEQIKVYDSGTDYTAKSGTSSDQYTLGPGERRYDAKGNLIATGGEKTTEPVIKKIDGVDYQYDPVTESYKKPTVPTGSSVQKVEQMQGIVDKINNLLSTDDWKAGVGPVSSSLVPDWASGKRNAAIASIEEIIANIAIDNLDKLKGPMSDKDIQFIKDASAGLRTNIDEESFKKKVESIRDKLKEKIANPAVTQTTQNTVVQAKTKEELKAEFPQATQQEIDALYQEELGKSNDLSTSQNFSKVAKTGATGGQCGIFSRKLVDYPSGLGDKLSEKQAFVNKVGIPAKTWRNDVRVGDVIITNENSETGHVAVVNKILPNGKIQLSESNYNLDEKINNNRVIDVNSPVIYGAVRGKLKV